MYYTCKKVSTEIISDYKMEACLILNTETTSEVPILPQGFSTFECKLCSRINIININGQENISFKCKGCTREFSTTNLENKKNSCTFFWTWRVGSKGHMQVVRASMCAVASTMCVTTVTMQDFSGPVSDIAAYL